MEEDNDLYVKAISIILNFQRFLFTLPPSTFSGDAERKKEVSLGFWLPIVVFKFMV